MVETGAEAGAMGGFRAIATFQEGGEIGKS
jgi:hypothetical protein